MAPLVPILDFAEEEAEQLRRDWRWGTEQMDAEVDRLVREGRALVEYVKADAGDQPPLDESLGTRGGVPGWDIASTLQGNG